MTNNDDEVDNIFIFKDNYWVQICAEHNIFIDNQGNYKTVKCDCLSDIKSIIEFSKNCPVHIPSDPNYLKFVQDNFKIFNDMKTLRNILINNPKIIFKILSTPDPFHTYSFFW